MPLEVLLAVLFGALLHAGWNALVRAAPEKLPDTVLIVCGAALLGAVGLPFLEPPASASWPWLAASVLLHVGYFAAVASAYRHGELGFAYPLMRGTAPVLVTLAAAAWLAEWPSATGAGGIALVSCGILLLAHDGWRRGRLHRHTVRFALANAGVIAAYTLVDGIGARLSGQPFAYTAWLFVLTAPVLFAAALPLHGSRLWSGWRRWPRGLLGGACTLAAYALALWAMTRAPLALVAALRETSAVFALLLGTLWLREPLSRSRVVAVGVVAAGAMAIRLA